MIFKGQRYIAMETFEYKPYFRINEDYTETAMVGTTYVVALIKDDEDIVLLIDESKLDQNGTLVIFSKQLLESDKLREVKKLTIDDIRPGQEYKCLLGTKIKTQSPSHPLIIKKNEFIYIKFVDENYVTILKMIYGVNPISIRIETDLVLEILGRAFIKVREIPHRKKTYTMRGEITFNEELSKEEAEKRFYNVLRDAGMIGHKGGLD